jgi:RNA polymerase sigma factor (sigma-70 family)
MSLDPCSVQVMADWRTMPGPPPVVVDPSLEDEAWMAAYRTGDARAFERLYERHRAGVFRFVRRLLGRAHEAWVDEVFQDTWLRVVHAREQWAPQGATFRTWLYTLAHNRAMDVLRRSGREVRLGDERAIPDEDPFEPAGAPWADWPVPDDGAPSQDHRLFWRRAGERLLDCLGELPIAQKAVFLLHHQEGETLDTIAAQLGVEFETAKSRLRYAMRKLRLCMGAYLDPRRDGPPP